MTITRTYGYEWELLEPNTSDFTDEDYHKLHSNLELRTACCHEVVPHECVMGSCCHSMPNEYMERLANLELDNDPPMCVVYFENGYIFHANCPYPRSIQEFASAYGDKITELMQSGQIDKEDGMRILPTLRNRGDGISQHDRTS